MSCLKDLIKKVKDMAAESFVEESKGIAQGLVVWQSIWHGLSLSEGSDVNIFAL